MKVFKFIFGNIEAERETFCRTVRIIKVKLPYRYISCRFANGKRNYVPSNLISFPLSAREFHDRKCVREFICSSEISESKYFRSCPARA